MSHQKFHPNKRGALTETVTTVFYETIVWVDSDGKIINTEINTPLPGGTATTSQADTTAGPSSVDSTQTSTTSAPFLERPNDAPTSSDLPPPPPSTVAQSSPASTSTASAASSPASLPSSAPGSSKTTNTAAGMGICYDMIDSSSQCKSQATASSDFAFLKSQGYGIVHVYDIGCPVGDFATAAAQNGLQLLAGINAISNLQGDLGKLIGMLNGEWGTVHTVYIGNELVNDGLAAADAVAGAVNQARGMLQSAGYNGNVITIDTFNVMQSNPTVCSTSDYCAANAHAYFDPNTAAENAGNFVLNAYNAVKAGNGGKDVIITETGWPYAGSCNGQACPSIDNQKAAMNSIIQSFSAMPGNVFLFQAYNAGYKQPGPNGVEQFFGIYDANHFSGGISPV